MSTLPSHDELQALVGQVLIIATADDAAAPLTQARLLSAPAGRAADHEHTCYRANFELPENLRLPQDTYRFCAPDGRAWLLFATPARPLESGAGVLCVVIHTRLDETPAAARASAG
ncbi:hypothetical protein KDX16_02935 [Burkholderia vietnamiensis]|uniref:DUF6916 family protein n=1 Tax=Burkholderia vietnamiensis TaxID=60552 RepID=UPI001B8F3CF3|nr:hypothetical protein [Burkholderia vietnamiensis]